MATAYHDLTFIARRTVKFDETYSLLDGAVPVDLTGYTFAFALRQYAGAGGSALLSLGVVTPGSEGIGVIDATGGEIRLVINQATLAGLPDNPDAEAGDPALFAAELRGVHATKDTLVLGMRTNKNFILYEGV